MSYGWCRVCGGEAVSRARNPIGPTTCENGHSFPHAETLNKKPTAEEIIFYKTGINPISVQEFVAEKTAAAAATLGDIADADGPAERLGALVYAVANQSAAAKLSKLVVAYPQPDTEGVRVIPFGASALAYCGRSARLFRGIVVITPREDDEVTVEDFKAWVRSALIPYLAPGAELVAL